MRNTLVLSAALALMTSGAAPAQGHAAAPYPAMAPIAQYRMTPADEIALARSAAPPSISGPATILVLGSTGYTTAVKGTNGFVCFVGRSWASTFDDPEFWNPKERSPNCFNAPAARSELANYVQLTKWVLAGDSKAQLMAKSRAARASGAFKMPEPDSIAFMLSKRGYLNDQAGGPWLPHVMFFVPRGQAASWGANLPGSPVLGQDGASPASVFFVPVRRWSDGSPAPVPAEVHKHSH